jgi:hypothetical protein
MARCDLCWKENVALQEHHLVPQHIVKLINKENRQIKKLKIFICDDCHKKIHDSFITHLEMSGCIKGFNKIQAVEYNLLKAFLMEKDPKIWYEYKNYKKQVITDLLNTMDDDTEIQDGKQEKNIHAQMSTLRDNI